MKEEIRQLYQYLASPDYTVQITLDVWMQFSNITTMHSGAIPKIPAYISIINQYKVK